MKLLMSSIAVLGLFINQVASHGYLTIPVSRTRLAFEAGREQCPECTILEPVNAWPDVCLFSLFYFILFYFILFYFIILFCVFV